MVVLGVDVHEQSLTAACCSKSETCWQPKSGRLDRGPAWRMGRTARAVATRACRCRTARRALRPRRTCLRTPHRDVSTPDRGSLAEGLVVIGEEAVAKSNDRLFYDYYTEDYQLHSPAGQFNREEIRAYFAALRASFTDFTIRRAQVLVDGNFVSARTVMAGRFDKEFAYTPIGTVQPNGQHVQWELINIFRYTDDGRLAEEWVQTDTYDLLRQLGAVGN